MAADIEKIMLLDRLYKLRRDRRRLSASIITTYCVNLPFYEDVLLRHLEAAGSRLNVVLVDASELAKSFLAGSTRPRRAGRDYLLLPVSAGGAFHPKIIALFSEEGIMIAVGSHNLTEAGFGRNGEITAMFGFGPLSAPLNISQPITDYLIQCAGQLAPGHVVLSRRLAERLRQQSKRGPDPDEDVTFIGTIPGREILLEGALRREELATAQRILVVGPYFDDDLKFLAELRKRAPQARLFVGVQPDHTIMRRPDRLPPRAQLCNADAAGLPLSQRFMHAKALVLEAAKQTTVVIGSANPSAPAWTAKAKNGNFEAVIALRGESAKKALRMLGLGKLWLAPMLSKEQIKQMRERSRTAPQEDRGGHAAIITGAWKDGWVEAQVEDVFGEISAIRTLMGPDPASLTLEGAVLSEGVLRFAAPMAGAFAVELRDRSEPLTVIAFSIADLSQALVSSTAARLIDELGRLGDGTAPGDELLDLCEKVLLRTEEDDVQIQPPRAQPKGRTKKAEADGGEHGPRGISINELGQGSTRSLSLSLDISAIITLLLKQLEAPREEVDPSAEEVETEEAQQEGEGRPGEDTLPADEQSAPQPLWEDVVRAIRPRVTRLLNRLADRIEEKHPAKWKYERVLVLLALLKRLRKYHPGTDIPFSGQPERLVNEEQLFEAFKLAMRCCFARDDGVLGALEQIGGIETEYQVIGRSLLLWAAYEAGLDVSRSLKFDLEPDELHDLQADRTDALISAIAACASPETMERARRELFDRGAWTEPCDRRERIEAWFNRHVKVGEAIQKALGKSRPPCLPVLSRPPSLQDIVIWKTEPAWPRFPEMISGRTVHLSDVGDAEPIKVAQQFVQTVDTDALGIRSVLTHSPAPGR